MSQGTLKLVKPNYPTRLVLSLTKTQGQMRATWATRDFGKPTVKWGLAPGKYSKSAVGTTGTYTKNDLCSEPATGQGFHSPGSINTAVMTDLKPDTRYYYVVGDNKFGFSEEASFLTAPTDSVSLLMVADHGTINRDKSRYFMGGYGRRIYQTTGIPEPGFLLTAITALTSYLELPAGNSAEIVTRALDRFTAKNKYHSLFINGDFAYTLGSIARYSNYIQENSLVLKSMPLIGSSGNHESTDPELPYTYLPNNTDSQGECGVPYNKLFGQPAKTATQQWFSVDIGPVHFIQISTDQDFKVGSAQHKFVAADLAAVNRTKTPWVIAGFHRPLYIDDPDAAPLTGAADYAEALRQNLEPLFVEFEVDMTHSGHIHLYHRTCPVIKGRCVRKSSSGVKAPVHVVAGNAGAPGFYLTYTNKPTWADKEVLSLGMGTLDVNRTHLEWKLYTGTTPTTVSVADTLVLTKPPNWKPNRAAAKALYDRTDVLPPAEANVTWGAIRAVVPTFPTLLQQNQKLANACFGPDTEIYNVANAIEIPPLIPTQNWKFMTSVLTFIKATWQGDPGAVLNGYTTEEINDSLEYSYNVMVKGRLKLSSLPADCTI
jgi:hypothetical protein